MLSKQINIIKINKHYQPTKLDIFRSSD